MFYGISDIVLTSCR